MSPSFASCLLESQAEPYASSLASAPSATHRPPSSTAMLRHQARLGSHGPSSVAGLSSSFLCCLKRLGSFPLLLTFQSPPKKLCLLARPLPPFPPSMKSVSFTSKLPQHMLCHCSSPRVSLTVYTCVSVSSRLFMVSPWPAFGHQHTGVSGMAAFYSDRIVHNLNTPLLTNPQHKQLERGPLGNGICPVPYL